MDKIYCADVWFATAKEQRERALAKGADARNIYSEGVGAESFETCIRAFRGDRGRLGLVGGLYILGQTSDALKARLAVLREKRITPYDFETGEADGAMLYGDALGSIMGSKKMKRDRKRHKRMSTKGGIKKGESMAERRDGIADKRVIIAITNAPELTWERKVEILGMSEATLRRHYYEKL